MATEYNEVTDSNGRVIRWEKMGVLEETRFLRLMGSEDSNNVQLSNLCKMAYLCTHLNGVPMPPKPVNLVQLEARIKSIGDEGYAAIFASYSVKLREAQEAEEKRLISLYEMNRTDNDPVPLSGESSATS